MKNELEAKVSECVRLDLNNPVFQRQLFALQKNEQLSVLNILRKVSSMTWQQIYQDSGLKSIPSPNCISNDFTLKSDFADIIKSIS